jgi:site-specific DNA-methyltransferase (adenine-specific)
MSDAPAPVTIGKATLYLGDCLARLRELADASVDAVVTDPPYGLTFMGRHWDYDVPTVEIWAECLRVLKPGGHLLAFAGTRTQHRMAVRIEDAGFEIRDMIAWVYGSGFPKSLDVSKAIDKAAGVERDRVPGPKSGGMASLNKGNAARGYRDAAYYDDGNMMLSPDPATDAARQWAGWGTALKPALEPVTVARKPLIGTVADNVLTHGTGGLNVDGCRVGNDQVGARAANKDMTPRRNLAFAMQKFSGNPAIGRWPANLIHDGSDEVVGLFPVTQTGGLRINGVGASPNNTVYQGGWRRGQDNYEPGNTGSAARFFYTAKASKSDRNEGCQHLEAKVPGHDFGTKLGEPRSHRVHTATQNHHPTVKPTDLMRYLCRLVTPPGGTVLDPFMGSGSTGKGAVLEGFRFIGIEREADYFDIARTRIDRVQRQTTIFDLLEA